MNDNKHSVDQKLAKGARQSQMFATVLFGIALIISIVLVLGIIIVAIAF
jgi:hypothetical protein